MGLMMGAAGRPEGWLGPEQGDGPGLSSQHPSSMFGHTEPSRSQECHSHLFIHSTNIY